MKFLIVAPKFVRKLGDYYNFPIGLGYISSAMKAAGFDVECLNLNNYTQAPADLIEKTIVERGVDVVMTGGLSAHYHLVREILESARRAKPDVVTIFGGGLVTTEPELIMEALKADFGVLGEGEITAVELAETLQKGEGFDRVDGIIYPGENGDFTTTAPRAANDELDSLPRPDYEGFGIDQFLEMQMPGDSIYSYIFDNPREFPIISSRSCPYNCQRSLDNFFAEVDHLVSTYNINILIIFDELFAVDRKRLEEFCRRIKPYGLKWNVTLRVDSVDRETLSMMKEAGCFFISYGLESASDIILQSMNKHITIAQVKEALQSTREAGIAFQGNFLFSDPAENRETFNQTVEWWKNHREYHIIPWLISPYPGTQLYHDAVKKGIIKDKLKYIEEGCPPINLTDFSEEEYRALLLELEDLQHLKYRIFSRRLRSWKIYHHPQKGDIFTLELECPSCGETVVYRNFNNIHGREFFKLYCRRCHQRFDIAPWQLHREEVEAMFNRANELASAGNLREAYQALLPLKELFPSMPEGRMALSDLAAELGDFEAAIEQINAAVWLVPSDPGLRVKQGLTYYRGDRVRESENSFLEALRLEPGNLPALQSLAEIARLRGDLHKAVEYLNLALKAHPGDPNLRAAKDGLMQELQPALATEIQL